MRKYITLILLLVILFSSCQNEKPISDVEGVSGLYSFCEEESGFSSNVDLESYETNSEKKKILLNPENSDLVYFDETNLVYVLDAKNLVKLDENINFLESENHNVLVNTNNQMLSLDFSEFDYPIKFVPHRCTSEKINYPNFQDNGKDIVNVGLCLQGNWELIGPVVFYGDGYEFTEEGIHRIIQIFPKENEPSNIIIYDFEIQYLPFINLLEDNEAPSAAIVSESSNLDVRKIKISYDEEFDLEKFKNIDGEYYPPTFPYMRGIMFINKPNKNFCISKVNLNFEDSIINSVWDNLYIEGGSINARVYDVKIEQKPLLQGGAGIGVTHSFDTNMIVENSEIVAIKSIIFLEDLSYNLFYNSFKKGNSFLYLKNNNILGLLYSIYMKAGGLLSEGNRYIIPSSADGQNIYFSGEQNEEDLLFEKQITQRVFDGDVFYLFDDLEYIPIINLNLERPDVWIGDNPLKFVFYHLDIINLEDLNYMISSVDLKSNYYELSIDNLIEFYDVFLNIPTNYYLFTDINKNKISLDAHIIVGETLFHKQKELKIGGGFID